jgi:antitoxin HicB
MMKTIEDYLALPYAILLTPLSHEDGGGWLAEIPSLPGCMSDGETQAEALLMIEDAKRGWIESALAHGDPVPEPALHLA